MNDELTVKIADELINVAQLVEARMESGEWDDTTYVDPEDIAERIIALVRVDERKRIREALLGEASRYSDPFPIDVSTLCEIIGLTEEPS